MTIKSESEENMLVKIVEENVELKSKVFSLEKENEQLRAALLWYVENDDTMETAYNEPWLKGKRKAMKLLEILEDDD
jgi:hypothetical protein